ncbi:MAG: polymerase sigma factor, sigma-70 family [Chthonomonadaceae bacterium]|nr:polymerase sigma factor, sigma-70 family [Chthonomonadaceae bacterium]
MSAAEAEKELTARAMAGDQEAFSTLCERSRSRLWRIVSSVAPGPDRDDLAQEAIVRAWCAVCTYRAEASFEAWICRIAVNAAHDYQKSAWRRRIRFWQSDQIPETTVTEPLERIAERREAQRRVRQAVAALPTPQRVPIWLHFFEEFSLAEVARLERTAESTVRSRVQAGMRRLARELQDLQLDDLANPVRIDTEAKGWTL